MPETQSLKIIIVGAGLGGLAAAPCLARDGHKVQLYERRPTFKPKGGGIMIRPTASRFLRQWDLQTDFEAISDASPANEYIDGLTGKVFTRRNTAAGFDGNPDWGTFREDAQAVFYKHAVRHGADVKFNVSVADVSENDEVARVHLSTGETVEADLVLAADGILSRLRAKIIPNAPSPVPGWSTIYQGRAEEQDVLADPDAMQIASTQNLQVWMKRGGGGYIVARCNKSLHRQSGAFAIPETDESSKMWDEHGDIEYVRDYFRDYAAPVTALLKIFNSCDRWRLAEMPDLPQWISAKGRLVLLGDSCHAMLPSAAMGFTTIVEDIGVMSYLLKHHISKGVPALMKIWQDVRQPRVNRIKEWAKSNHTMYTKGTGSLPKEKMGQTMGEISLEGVEMDRDAGFRTAAFMKWALGFDAVKDVERYVSGMDRGARL